MIKRPIRERDRTIIKMYATKKIHEAKPDRTEGRNIDSSTITVGNIKTSLSVKDRPTRKMTDNLNNTINQPDQTYTDGAIQQ